MTTLTWDQRKQKNFRKSFFAIETAFYFLQGLYITGLIVLTDYQMAVLFGLDYNKITTIIFIIGIPTYLKMFTALISDRVSIGKFGKRKPYLVIGAAFFAISFSLLYFFNAYSILYIIVLLLAYIGFMFVDGTADALTVDLTPINEASRMQGFAQAGKYAGTALAYILGSRLAPAIGWNNFTLLIGVIAIAQALVPLLFKEIESTQDKKKKYPGIIESFKLSFGNWPAIQGLIFAFVFMSSIGITSVMGPLMLNKVGLQVYGDSRLIGYVVLSISTATIGTLIRRWGGFTNRNVFISFALIWLLFTPWLMVMQNWENVALIYIAQICMGIARGITIVVTYALIMPLCNSTVEGFMFATFTSFMNIGRGLATKTVAFFGETVGIGMVPAIFVILPIMGIGLLMVPGINRGIAQIKQSQIETIEPVEA